MELFREKENEKRKKEQQCFFMEEENQHFEQSQLLKKNTIRSIKQASKGLFASQVQANKQNVIKQKMSTKLQESYIQAKKDYAIRNNRQLPVFQQDTTDKIGKLTIKQGNISNFYKPIKIIQRFKCRQLFLLEQISKQKGLFLMKSNKKKQIVNKQLIEGQTQIRNLLILNHPNILKIKEIFNNYNKFLIILQYFEGVTLIDYLMHHQINQQIGKSIIRQLLLALQSMHQKNIIHRDIRPEHLYVSNYHHDPSKIKLTITDLRLSISNQKLKKCKNKIVGSHYYASPESSEGIITQKYDIWSAGIVALVIFCQFQRNFIHNQQYLQAINLKNQLYFHHLNKVPPNVLDFIDFLLVIKHRKRPTAQEALDHPWLSLNSYEPKRIIKKNVTKELFQQDLYFEI